MSKGAAQPEVAGEGRYLRQAGPVISRHFLDAKTYQRHHVNQLPCPYANYSYAVREPPPCGASQALFGCQETYPHGLNARLNLHCVLISKVLSSLMRPLYPNPEPAAPSPLTAIQSESNS